MTKKSNSKPLEATIQPSEAIHEEHRQIIDEYFNNGLNGTRAVIDHRPDINYNSAKLIWHSIAKSEHGRQYIAERRRNMRATTQLAGEQIARTMLHWAHADATIYAGLTPDELRSLPNEQKACIQGIKYREKEYKDRQGNLIKEKICDVVLIDKLKALDRIAKHINFYAADNNSKQGSNTLNKILNDNATPDTLNALNKLVQIARSNRE